jgi:anti-anti-sigma factor
LTQLEEQKATMADKTIGITSSKLGPRKFSARTILTLRESLTYQNCEDVETMFNDCLEQQKTEIILDFRKVAFLDSEALELLLRMHHELKDRGGALKLVSLDTICLDILKATQLINVLRVYEDIHKAIKDVL